MRGSIVSLALLACVALQFGAIRAETVKCKASRDVWISSYTGETNCNMGASSKMKLKIYQEVGLVDFDVAALKGKQIKEAYLFLKPVGKGKLGLNGGTDVSWLSVATVAHDWVEGECAKDYGTDEAGNGATFLESSYKKDNWGWPGAKLWDVTLGNNNTLRHNDRLLPHNGLLRIKLDPRLVQAMVAGATHGVILMDGNTNVRVNSFFATRESGSGPYLEVITGEADGTAPGKPEKVKVEPAVNSANPHHGAIMVSLTVPDGAFAFNMKVDGKAVDRWQLPFAAKPGTTQTFPVVDLPPGKKLKIEISAIDGAGNESKVVSKDVMSSPALEVPVLPVSNFSPKKGEPAKLGDVLVWACPEVSKVDPTKGDVIFEPLGNTYRNANAIWDGAKKQVRLCAARGEIVSFQVVVEGKVEGCSAKLSDLKGPGLIGGKGIRYWRNWYVGRFSEYALPLDGTFDCPAKDNKVPNQNAQAVTIDIHIPKDAKAGEYKGVTTVAAGENKVELPVTIDVYDVVISDELNFLPELNCYGGGPGRPGSKVYCEARKLAHYHRCTVNAVPYAQGGYITRGVAPAVDASGKVKDWAAFDKAFGPLFDGSYFKDNPRAGMPVPVMYLPFCEGWPLKFRKHYNPGEGVPVSDKGDAKLKHDILAKPIEEAMSDTHKTAFKTCVKDFYAHFKEKGWNKTFFQFYLNNKPGKGSSMWTLDEPVSYIDFAALNFWGLLFKEAIADPEVYSSAWYEQYFRVGLTGMNRQKPTFMYRGDISRYYVQGDLCDGIMNAMYANNGMFGYPRTIPKLKKNLPGFLYAYGQCNKINRSNWESAAWCIKAYTKHCEGVLPWQTIKGPSNLWQGHVEGVVLVDTRKGSIAIEGKDYGPVIGSFRMHALRRGAQDCELLRLLQLKYGWSREHLGLLVSQKLLLDSSFKQAFSDEASAVTFKGLSSKAFADLKEGILKLLTAKSIRDLEAYRAPKPVKRAAGKKEVLSPDVTTFKGKPVTKVPFIEKAPEVNGDFSEDAWKKAKAGVFKYTDGTPLDPVDKTEALILSTAKGIYLGVTCFDHDMKTIRSKVAKRDGNIWSHDMIEVFLLPGEKPGGGYFHFGVNAHGSFCDSFWKRGQWNCPDVKVVTKRLADRWNVEMFIPLGKLPLPDAKDLFAKPWRFNIVRMRPKRDLEPAVETAWSPTLGSNSHVPGRFGYIYFDSTKLNADALGGQGGSGAKCGVLAPDSVSYRGCPIVFVSNAPSAPRLDGDLAEGAWKKAKALKFALLDGNSTTPVNGAEARVIATKEALFIGVTCMDKTMKLVKAPERKRDGPLYQDDCLEIFLKPGADSGSDYYQFDVNAGGAIYDSFKNNAKWNGAGFTAAAKRHEDRWCAELKIPFKDLKLPADKAKLAGAWRLNINRIRPQRAKQPLEETAWSPTLCTKSHVPSRFGYAFLEAFGAGSKAAPKLISENAGRPK